MNLGTVLVTGLFAGGVSCAAVQGGLLTGLVARQRDAASVASPSGTKARTAGGRAAGVVNRGGRSTTAARPRIGNTPPAASFRQRLADDLTPVAGFLAGKLVSHTLLGTLLGALGAAAQLSEQITALAQIGAGLLIVVLGLAQLGAPGFRNITITPPASWARWVRGRARSQSALAPALLGAATILIPCGVTLSVMALAVTSGSALAGAATMAVFVIGTGPLFAALGYAARKAATAWRGRLAAATGLVVLLLGLYTLNAGLVRAGSPVTARTVAMQAGFIDSPPTAETVIVTAAGVQQAVLTARTGRYRPGNIAVKAGIPTTLIVRADNAEGCVRAFVIPAMNQQWTLPVDGDTTIDLGILQPGTLDFTCAMGMYSGQLTIT